MNEGEVYFKLFAEDFNPESLTIGINPTVVKHKGNPIPKFSSWIYSKGIINAEKIDVYKISSLIVSELEPHAEKIIEVMKTYDLEAVLEVVLTISPDDSISTPAIGFDHDVISFLNKIGATIDIDTYIREIN